MNYMSVLDGFFWGWTIICHFRLRETVVYGLWLYFARKPLGREYEAKKLCENRDRHSNDTLKSTGGWEVARMNALLQWFTTHPIYCQKRKKKKDYPNTSKSHPLGPRLPGKDRSKNEEKEKKTLVLQTSTKSKSTFYWSVTPSPPPQFAVASWEERDMPSRSIFENFNMKIVDSLPYRWFRSRARELTHFHV